MSVQLMKAKKPEAVRATRKLHRHQLKQGSRNEPKSGSRMLSWKRDCSLALPTEFEKKATQAINQAKVKSELELHS